MAVVVLKPKRSEVSGAPAAEDLAVGEIAMNLIDAQLYSKKSDGTVVTFTNTTPTFFSDEVDLGGLGTATTSYDMSSLDGGSPASGGGIALTDLSVSTNSAGTAALSYNNSTGVFTYTPPDLSSYLTSYTVTESDVTTHQAALSITESQISDLGTYLTTETNDLTASVTWANVPDANITQSSVTQHQAALSITESQISDLGTYLTTETNDLTSAVTWANVPDANITESSVTQHQAALSITESQISDLQTYLTTVSLPIVKLTTSQTTSITDGSWTTHTWDSQGFIDTDTYTHSTTTNNSRLTVDSTGYYEITANLIYDNNTGSARNTVRACVFVNGTEQTTTATYDYDRGASYGERSNNKINTILSLTANDYIEIRAYGHNIDGTCSIYGSECELMIKRIQ